MYSYIRDSDFHQSIISLLAKIRMCSRKDSYDYGLILGVGGWSRGGVGVGGNGCFHFISLCGFD